MAVYKEVRQYYLLSLYRIQFKHFRESHEFLITNCSLFSSPLAAVILFWALILFSPWFDVILIPWILCSCFHLVKGETRVFHSFISFHHHFLFPPLLHFSSTTLLPSFLSIYNCHYPFFFSKWHFEFALLIGWLDWAPSCSSQTAFLYLLCWTGPSRRHRHLIFIRPFSLLEMSL